MRKIAARRRLLTGNAEQVYESLQELVDTIGTSPDETTYSFTEIDGDGDAAIEARGKSGATATIYLDSGAFSELEDAPPEASRASDVIQQIREGITSEE